MKSLKVKNLRLKDKKESNKGVYGEYMERGVVEKNVPVFFLLRCLLFSYILTAVLLLLLAFLLYKLGLSEQIVSVAIIVIYVVATFFAGFVAGKKMQSKKFMWGLLMGGLYFLVLMLVSFGVNTATATEMGNSFLTTFVLCAGGGMLGGMFG